MGQILDIVNKVTPIAQRRVEKTGEDYKVSIKEEIEKNLSETNQSKKIDSKYNIFNSIPPYCDIDNDEIYDIRTGKTIKEL